VEPNEPKAHHYAPQFYLRNFAHDGARKKIWAVAKHGDRAIWQERSIEYLGVQEDLYTVTVAGVPVSVERTIGHEIESPISESEAWEKISSNRADAITVADKAVIYALLRHFEARTPHMRQTLSELIDICEISPEKFSAEEREMYYALRQDFELRSMVQAYQASSLAWTNQNFERAAISICRTQIPLRTSTTPVLTIEAPDHPALHLPLPNQKPYTLTMTLNRFAFATLTLGDFGADAFTNDMVSDDVANGYNRHRVAQFAHFDSNAHLIGDRNSLIEDMTWAPYEVELERADKITFRRAS
jgi:hypothetical protein